MQRPDPGRAPCDREPRARREVGAGPHRGARLTLGAIIAGGRASRFGSDKGAALFEGRALIDHAAAMLSRYCGEVVIVGRAWPGLRDILDAPEPGLGPLGGIAGALLYARSVSQDLVLTIGCDMPRVPDQVFAALLARAPAYCVDAPVLATWRAAWVEPLIDLLQMDRNRSVRRYAEGMGSAALTAPGELANINTPGDLAVLACDVE